MRRKYFQITRQLFQNSNHLVYLQRIVDEQSSEYEREKLTQAKRIIEPFMLRRLKENVLKDLPPKTITVEKCPLQIDQQKKYNEIMSEFKAQCESEFNSEYMVFFMRLRKMANHPLMLRYHFTVIFENYVRSVLNVCLISNR